MRAIQRRKRRKPGPKNSAPAPRARAEVLACSRPAFAATAPLDVLRNSAENVR